MPLCTTGSRRFLFACIEGLHTQEKVIPLAQPGNESFERELTDCVLRNGLITYHPCLPHQIQAAKRSGALTPRSSTH